MTASESAVAVTLGTTSQALRGDPQALDFKIRLDDCAQDPRVVAGLARGAVEPNRQRARSRAERP